MGLVTVSREERERERERERGREGEEERERERERMSHMVLRVADEVSMAICLRALARAAVSWE